MSINGIEKKLNDILNEIRSLKYEIQPIKHNYYEINELEDNKYFKYVLSYEWIDDFTCMLTKDDLKKRYFEFENVCLDDLDRYVKRTVFNICGEEPHTIGYTGNLTCGRLDLVVVAKISNNGTSFIFTNDKEYLEFINSRH